MSFDGVLCYIQSIITLPDFLSVVVAVKSFVNYETGMTAQPQFEFFAERSGRADDILYSISGG